MVLRIVCPARKRRAEPRGHPGMACGPRRSFRSHPVPRSRPQGSFAIAGIATQRIVAGLCLQPPNSIPVSLRTRRPVEPGADAAGKAACDGRHRRYRRSGWKGWRYRERPGITTPRASFHDRYMPELRICVNHFVPIMFLRLWHSGNIPLRPPKRNRPPSPAAWGGKALYSQGGCGSVGVPIRRSHTN